MFILLPTNIIRWRGKKVKLQPFCGRSDRARGLFTVRFETMADRHTNRPSPRKKRKDSVGTLINEDKQTHTCTCSHTAHAQTDSSHFWVWLPSFVISESEGSNVFQHWIKENECFTKQQQQQQQRTQTLTRKRAQETWSPHKDNERGWLFILQR